MRTDRHLEFSLLSQQRLQRNSWHHHLPLHPFFLLLLFLWQRRLGENHWHRHSSGLSSITTSHNPKQSMQLSISNHSNMSEEASPSNGFPTLAFTISSGFLRFWHVQTYCSGRNHGFSRMRVCFSAFLLKSCCLLHYSSSEVASILFQTKWAIFTPLYHYCHVTTEGFWVLFCLWPFCLGCISAVWRHLRSFVSWCT